MESAAALAARVRDLVDELEGVDLSPSPRVDKTFGELVDIALGYRGPFADDVVRTLGRTVRRARTLCARGETALETHWSERIATAPDPWSALDEFPYALNYQRLVALEFGVVGGLGRVPGHVVMLGSGPLPLTGVMLAYRHGCTVTVVDRDRDCLRAGDRLVRALGLSSRIRSERADAGRQRLDLSAAGLVVLGALVGDDPAAKRDLLGGVAAAMCAGSLLLARSAAGLRTLLYPPVSLDDVPGLCVQAEAHPHHDVVNSMVVARRV